MATEGKTTVVPKLRFPEFKARSGWQSTSLSDASTPVTERVGERKLTPVSISAGVGFVPQAEKFGRDISGNQYSLYTVVRDGDFVYNKGNSLKFPQGCVYQLRGWGEVAAPNVFISFRLKNVFVAEYFQYCFEKNIHGAQLKKHITSGARSNGLLNVSKNQFYGISIPTPLPDEQQKIADCLSSLDELIAAQVRKVQALKTYKRGLMQQLFPREGETLPRLRFPEFRDAPEWTPTAFGQAATFFNGKAYAKEELLERGKYKVLRVGNFFTSDRWYYSDLELEDTKYCDEGDLLYAWSASFGPRIWRGGRTIYHYHIWKVVEKSGIDRGFLFWALDVETDRIRSRSANGIGMFHITKGTIETWSTMIPSPGEQKKIADLLSSVNAGITCETNQLETLKAHKKGILQQLFPSQEEV